MKATKEINIYLTKKRNVRQIDVVQYDTGIQLVFTVMDLDIPSGATATLYVQKPSGKFVYQEDGITVADNTITIDLDNQAITEHGKVPYQVSLASGSDVITTFTGLMLVEKSLKDAGATESKTVVRAFDEAVADHVTEFQTKAEQIVAACIATIPDDYTAMEAKVNELANAIKGNLSGAVVVADDVSPVEHNPVVWVHGKNLLPDSIYDMANWEMVAGTVNNYVFPLTKLKDDTKYTISATVLDNSFGYFYIEKSANGFVTDSDIHLHFPNSSALPYTFEKEKGYEYRLFWYDDDHTFAEFVSNVQLEEGETATTYEPWIEPTTVSVKRCGKGVFAANEYELATQTAYAWSSILMAKIKVPHGIYTASCRFRQKGEKSRVALSMRDYDDHAKTLKHTDSQANEGTLKATFEVKDDNKGFQMFLYSNYSENKLATDCIFSDIQVECGTEATSYQPYNATTHVPAPDGTVSGMTSLSPCMTILTDTEGVIVECEYNQDTNKVIDKIITALGGAI